MLRSAALLTALLALLGPGLVGLGGAGAAADHSVTARTWQWPIGTPTDVVRPFVAPSTEYSAGHRGIDIGGAGDIVAPTDGVVHFAGVVVDRGVLSIAIPGDVLASFEPVTTALHEGDSVTRGEVIGHIDPGHCSQPCLHFGVRVHGEYVSPLLFLGGIERPVLLPTRVDARSRSSP